MANILSTRELRVEINGEQLAGFAADSPVIEFSDGEEFLEVVQGRDGSSYAIDTGQIGGEVTFKFLPTSPSVKTLLGWRHKWIVGERNNFTGSVSDSKLGLRIVLDLGYLLKCPVSPLPGMTSFDVTFFFEVIDQPNPESIKFQGVPASPLSSASGGTGGQGYGSLETSSTPTDRDNPITNGVGLFGNTGGVGGIFGASDAGREAAADGVDTGAGAAGGGFTFPGAGTSSIGSGGSSSVPAGSTSSQSPVSSTLIGLGSGQPASLGAGATFPGAGRTTGGQTTVGSGQPASLGAGATFPGAGRTTGGQTTVGSGQPASLGAGATFPGAGRTTGGRTTGGVSQDGVHHMPTKFPDYSKHPNEEIRDLYRVRERLEKTRDLASKLPDYSNHPLFLLGEYYQLQADIKRGRRFR